jgi:mRNA-degrading endonuclease RelE of RelBE toxin-antitoxin system
MSWRIEIKPSAEKQYLKLDRRTRARIKGVLRELETVGEIFHHSKVKPLVRRLQGDSPVRVGNWRVLFTPDKVRKVLYVYAVIPRGDAYKSH